MCTFSSLGYACGISDKIVIFKYNDLIERKRKQRKENFILLNQNQIDKKKNLF